MFLRGFHESVFRYDQLDGGLVIEWAYKNDLLRPKKYFGDFVEEQGMKRNSSPPKPQFA